MTYFDKKSNNSYELKLKEILQEKHNSFPVYLDGEIYQKLELNNEFTMALYNEWEKDPKFLTYVICYYFYNFVFEHDEIDFDLTFKFFDSDYRDNYIMFRFNFPFFIYQEQVESVANYLSYLFKDELENDINSNFPYWISVLINNLNENGKTLPKKKGNYKNKNKQIINIILFVLFLNFPFFISILIDFFLFLVLGKYNLIFISLLLYTVIKKLKIYIFSNWSLNIIFKDIVFNLRQYLKSMVLGICCFIFKSLFIKNDSYNFTNVSHFCQC